MRREVPQLKMTVTTMARVRRCAALVIASVLVLSGCAGAGSESGVPRPATLAITHVSIVDVGLGRLVPD